MQDAFAAGRGFILRHGRLLERRMFAVCFEDAPPNGVVEVLKGYRNDDAGFGHGLEPDKRGPASLPIDVEVALQAMATAGPSTGAVCSATTYWLPISTASSTTSNQTAGGPSPGSPRAKRLTWEWRGLVALGALRTLVSYGRMRPAL